MKLWLDLTGTICVNREKVESSTIKRAKGALQSKGWKLCIFIEGTRSQIEGQLGEPNSGPVYISRLCGVELLPVGIRYGKDKEATLKIGKPYKVSKETDINDESWVCLEKISRLTGFQMPPRN